MRESTAKDYLQLNEHLLKDFNGFLEKNSSVARLNEIFFEEKLNELKKIGPTCERIYWLTFARLNELAILCAGNYADTMEFASVGDFLINPRFTLVHFKNQNRSVIKERHAMLTDQFCHDNLTKIGMATWLKNETTVEVKKKPLLPYFYEILMGSGHISGQYLDEVDRRLKKIADAVGFFACQNFVDNHEFYLRLQNTSEQEKEFINSNFCRFDTNTFDQLGSDFYHLIRGKDHISRFLKLNRGCSC